MDLARIGSSFLPLHLFRELLVQFILLSFAIASVTSARNTRKDTPIKGRALISSIVAMRPLRARNSCSQFLISALTVVASIVV